jgi:hypothetical protein
MMFGVNGGIFAPVRRAWSGTMQRPVLHELGVTDGEAFFPNATTPPRTTVPIRRITNKKDCIGFGEKNGSRRSPGAAFGITLRFQNFFSTDT